MAGVLAAWCSVYEPRFLVAHGLAGALGHMVVALATEAKHCRPRRHSPWSHRARMLPVVRLDQAGWYLVFCGLRMYFTTCSFFFCFWSSAF